MKDAITLEIARELNISRDMARLWRNRWLELSVKTMPVLERLADAPRPGGPMTFNLEQILQLFAIACQKPEDYGRPISHWTPRELSDEVKKLGIALEYLPPPCEQTNGRGRCLLPHQSQYWLNPPPTFSSIELVKDICEVYLSATLACRAGGADDFNR